MTGTLTTDCTVTEGFPSATGCIPVEIAGPSEEAVEAAATRWRDSWFGYDASTRTATRSSDGTWRATGWRFNRC